jgi:HAMP domain-containing protein
MIATPPRVLLLLIAAMLAFQSAGCGTILYPERKGQRSGEIDVGVAVLDAIGLLFFIIPGVIAFAVDFNNGTIYLPRGSHRHALDLGELRQIRFDPGAGKTEIEAILSDTTGRAIRLDEPGLHVFELASVEQMMARFAEIRDERLASLSPGR